MIIWICDTDTFFYQLRSCLSNKCTYNIHFWFEMILFARRIQYCCLGQSSVKQFYRSASLFKHVWQWIWPESYIINIDIILKRNYGVDRTVVLNDYHCPILWYFHGTSESSRLFRVVFCRRSDGQHHRLVHQ